MCFCSRGGFRDYRNAASAEISDNFLDLIKWVGQFVGEAGATYHFDLCPDSLGSGTNNFDPDIKITDGSCNILDGEDGYCSSPSYSPNNFQWTCPANGTYYVIIAPFHSYDSHSCGGTTNDTFILEYYKGVLDPPVLREEPNITPGLCNLISWDSVPEANEYYAECSSDPCFSIVDSNSGWITGTSYEFCDLISGQEYWYRARLAFGNE